VEYPSPWRGRICIRHPGRGPTGFPVLQPFPGLSGCRRGSTYVDHGWQSPFSRDGCWRWPRW